ncbi:MAG: hypothetical protein CME19_05055 [Gemmatimonadetes bacterium]|nr:hypothetical protein [Gemmatimonadota bacterium]
MFSGEEFVAAFLHFLFGQVFQFLGHDPEVAEGVLLEPTRMVAVEQILDREVDFRVGFDRLLIESDCSLCVRHTYVCDNQMLTMAPLTGCNRCSSRVM